MGDLLLLVTPPMHFVEKNSVSLSQLTETTSNYGIRQWKAEKSMPIDRSSAEILVDEEVSKRNRGSSLYHSA